MTASHDPWESGAAWWLESIADDPIYQSDVLPLLRRLVGEDGGPWLDVGCGDGRAAGVLPDASFGCDIAPELLRVAADRWPVVRCRLPRLDWIRDGALSGASLVLVMEHVADLPAVFVALHRAIRPGGHLVTILNHPAFTAAGAGPIVDAADGEVLWRWGRYFTPHPVATPLGAHVVTFYHRPLGELLTTAAAGGWSLELLVERPLSSAAVAAEPGYLGQEQAPRLMGISWQRSAPHARVSAGVS